MNATGEIKKVTIGKDVLGSYLDVALRFPIANPEIVSELSELIDEKVSVSISNIQLSFATIKR